MLHRFARFLLQSNKNAAAVAFVCSLLPAFLGSLSAVIVALVTLCKGERPGFFVLAWGALPLLAQAWVQDSYLFFCLVLVAFFLVWAMAVMLRRYASWGMVLDFCVFLGALIVLASFVVHTRLEAWWVNTINDYMANLRTEVFFSDHVVLSVDNINMLAKLLTGLEVLLLLLVAWFKLVFAYWWSEKLIKKKTLKTSLLKVRLQVWDLLLLMALLVGALLTKKLLFVEALIPVVGFFIVAGLCLLHDWMQGYPYAFLALCGFYVVLVIFPYVVLLPLMMGLIDSGVNIRERLLKRGG